MGGEGGCPAYSAHDQLVLPVRPRSEIWRVLVGLTLVAVVVFSLNAALFALVSISMSEKWVLDFLAGTAPGPMITLLASFGFVILGVVLAVRQMQHRSLGSVIGPFRQTVHQFRQALRVLVILGGVILVLPPYDMGTPLEPNLPFAQWLILLPLSLLAVLIQTGAEEILFRGYIQQSLAARFRSPLIWMVVPSVLFAMGHYLPAQAGDNAVLIALWSGVFGLLMADLTARAGTLGPAIALHLFNNVIALLFVALPGSLDGLALFLIPYEMSDTEFLRDWLYVDFAMMLTAWLAARIAIRR